MKRYYTSELYSAVLRECIAAALRDFSTAEVTHCEWRLHLSSLPGEKMEADDETKEKREYRMGVGMLYCVWAFQRENDRHIQAAPSKPPTSIL